MSPTLPALIPMAALTGSLLALVASTARPGAARAVAALTLATTGVLGARYLSASIRLSEIRSSTSRCIRRASSPIT